MVEGFSDISSYNILEYAIGLLASFLAFAAVVLLLRLLLKLIVILIKYIYRFFCRIRRLKLSLLIFLVISTLLACTNIPTDDSADNKTLLIDPENVYQQTVILIESLDSLCMVTNELCDSALCGNQALNAKFDTLNVKAHKIRRYIDKLNSAYINGELNEDGFKNYQTLLNEKYFENGFCVRLNDECPCSYLLD